MESGQLKEEVVMSPELKELQDKFNGLLLKVGNIAYQNYVLGIQYDDCFPELKELSLKAAEIYKKQEGEKNENSGS